MAKDPIVRLGDKHQKFRIQFWAYFEKGLLESLKHAAAEGCFGKLTGFSGVGLVKDGPWLAFEWQAGDDAITYAPATAEKDGAGHVYFDGDLDFWTINLLRNHPVFHLRGQDGLSVNGKWPVKLPKAKSTAPSLSEPTPKCPRCWHYLATAKSGPQNCPNCGQTVRPLRGSKGARWSVKGQQFRLVEATNRPVTPLRFGFAFESFQHPELAATRDELGLDAVVAPWRKKGEFHEQLALLEWCSSAATSGQNSVKSPTLSNKYYPIRKHVELAQTKGANFFCTYKSIATVQLCAAMGWTARLVNATCGDNRRGYDICPHMINEIWSNEHAKWYFSDSLFNIRAMKDGIPLSCGELREEFYRNRGQDVVYVWGVQQIPLPYNTHGVLHPQLHEWYVAYLHNNFFDTPPDGGVLYPLLMLRDKYNAGKPWRRANGEGNIYVGQGNVIEVADREAMEFPLNVVELMGDIRDDGLWLNALTRTPCLKQLQIKVGDRAWRTFQPGTLLPWPEDELSVRVRAVNTLNVRGPESSLTVRVA